MFRTTWSQRSARSQRGAAHATRRGRVLVVVAVAALGVSALTGCAAGQIAQTVEMVPNHDGAHGTVGPVGVHNALLAVPDSMDGAIAYAEGASIPLSLWVTSDAFDDDTLDSITSSSGEVTLSGTATILANSSLQIGGADADVTATLAGVTEDLKYGFPVTFDFHFANAGDLSLKIPMEIPAERAPDRERTDIYPGEVTNVWGEPEPADADN